MLYNIFALNTLNSIIPNDVLEIIKNILFKLDKIKISCGKDHSIIKYKDEIYGCGNNYYGQLGIDFNTDTLQKLDLKNVKKISCGDDHSAFLTYDNEVYVTGRNVYGQLGLGDYIDRSTPHKLDLSNVRKIICGSIYTVAITNNNEVYIWGNNSHW